MAERARHDIPYLRLLPPLAPLPERTPQLEFHAHMFHQPTGQILHNRGSLVIGLDGQCTLLLERNPDQQQRAVPLDMNAPFGEVANKIAGAMGLEAGL